MFGLVKFSTFGICYRASYICCETRVRAEWTPHRYAFLDRGAYHEAGFSA